MIRINTATRADVMQTHAAFPDGPARFNLSECPVFQVTP